MNELLPLGKSEGYEVCADDVALVVYPPSPPVIEHRRERAVKGASPRRVRRPCP